MGLETTGSPPSSPEPASTLEEKAPAAARSTEGVAVALTLKITNVDFDGLRADAALKEAFIRRIGETCASQAGAEVSPADVTVTLHANPDLHVDAVVSLAHAAEPTEQVLEQLADGSLPGNLAAAEADLEGISGVSMGVIGVEVTSAPRTVADTLFAAVAAPAAAPAPAPAVASSSQDQEVCYPRCVEGHGICSDGVCLCKPPYHGKRCRRVIGGTVRIGWAPAFLAVFVALILGAVLGGIAFEWKLQRHGAKGSLFDDADDDIFPSKTSGRQSGGSGNASGQGGTPMHRHEVWKPG